MASGVEENGVYLYHSLCGQLICMHVHRSRLQHRRSPHQYSPVALGGCALLQSRLPVAMLSAVGTAALTAPLNWLSRWLGVSFGYSTSGLT